ncbi:MAG: phenol hydroxylase subunit [Magnetospiraceae bacterium]
MEKTQAPARQVSAPTDPLCAFVRVTGRRSNGFIEFDFAVGDPDVYLEMILGPEAFIDFCQENRVTFLAPPGASENAPHDPDQGWEWRLADATRTRFKTEI